MSTEIAPLSGGPVVLSGSGTGYVRVLVRDALVRNPQRSLPRAAFLAAVETECGVRMVPADALVIERASLPRVTVRADGSVSVKAFTWSGESDPDDLREVAACYLAAADFLDAHPPVPPVSDEDVETLAGLLSGAVPIISSWDTVARRLLATGRVSVTHE